MLQSMNHSLRTRVWRRAASSGSATRTPSWRPRRRTGPPSGMSLSLQFRFSGNSALKEWDDAFPRASKPFLRPLDERDIQRTYFAQEGTYVSTWNECFKSETKNFLKNAYSLHKIGKVSGPSYQYHYNYIKVLSQE